jgi:hypothetical protein
MSKYHSRTTSVKPIFDSCESKRPLKQWVARVQNGRGTMI